jgi:hypothetical protein
VHLDETMKSHGRNPLMISIRYHQMFSRLLGSELCGSPIIGLFRLVAVSGMLALCSSGHLVAQPATFALNAQHTALSSTPAQSLSRTRWTTAVDLNNTGALAHYGAPVITPSNTVIVPVKTTNGVQIAFQVSAFEGTTGRLKYTLTTDYILPSYNNSGIPAYQPVLAASPSGWRLYYAGAGGTVYHIDNPDSDTPGAPVHVCFYTNLNNYSSNAAAFNNTIFINTPFTADTNGVIFFGFRVQQTAPAPLSTTNSGFVRLDSSDNANYVLAGTAAATNLTYRDSHNCAPALSNDGGTLYVAVKSGSDGPAYLLGLDSTTLATKHRRWLLDPRNGLEAGVPEGATASPMVAPDGDVFFGVGASFSSPNGYRGFMLHFSADLQTQKPPSGFGWDYTGAIVPTNMVPSYTGTSAYLLFSKYNNYTDGINRLALLDPGATQIDPNPDANGLVEMREIQTVIGCTPSSYPAVREWCINTTAVDPATGCVFAPSEDGHIYRWNLALNSLTEVFTLTAWGVSEAYVPTIIGPDGAVYTLFGGTLFALSGLTNLAVSVSSSSPDLRYGVVGQPVTFTAIVTNLDASGPVPTGSVTFLDQTYNGLTPETNTLAANVPLTNGVAVVSTSVLSAGSNYLGNHFISANYSGDANFQAGSASLVQKVHASATTTTLVSSNSGNTVTFAATVAANTAGYGTPSGMVAFWDGSTFVYQAALNTNGIVACTVTNLGGASHSISASYASDTFFAASSGALVPIPAYLFGLTMLSNSLYQISFSNISGAPFTVLGAPDFLSASSNWTVLGLATETVPGQFEFTDTTATNSAQRFYRVRSP